ncbi:MAG: hypothetical protein GY929_09185 [Actinomycetia bacterium]|nr:hypothetical protein [Actinomycetes bacterium]
MPFPRRPPAPADHQAGPAASLTVDCDQCRMQYTDACGDCLVTFLCGAESEHEVVIDGDEARALQVMADAGMVPQLRHQSRVAN